MSIVEYLEATTYHAFRESAEDEFVVLGSNLELCVPRFGIPG